MVDARRQATDEEPTRLDGRGRPAPPGLHLLPPEPGAGHPGRADPAHPGRPDDRRGRPGAAGQRGLDGQAADPGAAEDQARAHPLPGAPGPRAAGPLGGRARDGVPDLQRGVRRHLRPAAGARRARRRGDPPDPAAGAAPAGRRRAPSGCWLSSCSRTRAARRASTPTAGGPAAPTRTGRAGTPPGRRGACRSSARRCGARPTDPTATWCRRRSPRATPWHRRTNGPTGPRSSRGTTCCSPSIPARSRGSTGRRPSPSATGPAAGLAQVDAIDGARGLRAVARQPWRCCCVGSGRDEEAAAAEALAAALPMNDAQRRLLGA